MLKVTEYFYLTSIDRNFIFHDYVALFPKLDFAFASDVLLFQSGFSGLSEDKEDAMIHWSTIDCFFFS